MTMRRERCGFALVLAALVSAFLHPSLFQGKVLSPSDVVLAQASFATPGATGLAPSNRLLIDPVLQFQPWLEFNRAEWRAGRIPLWNPHSGCGAPHLANGQSGVFDPFHLIAYLGTLPQANAWMAAARLWFAGFGMFLLATRWGLGPWGRWFAGLTFPLTGFLIVWLQFPVTSAAIWMPWIFWAFDRAWEQARLVAALPLAAFVAGTIFAGHIQTTTHMLIALVVYATWRLVTSPPRQQAFARSAKSLAALGIGVGLAGVQILPLGAYLTRSPVWSDRDADRPAAVALTPPRLLDATNLAFPYIFGSQRDGHPNLAKPLGVHNLNESAGGFAGLATLIWLAPLALMRRRDMPRVKFLAALALAGFLIAYEIPPFANLVRLIPIINVIDHRRLGLWIAFSLVLLGGIGLDRLAATGESALSVRPRLQRLATILAVTTACAFLTVALALTFGMSRLEPLARQIVGSRVPSVAVEKITTQLATAQRFLPAYYLYVAAQILCVVWLANRAHFSQGLNSADHKQLSQRRNRHREDTPDGPDRVDVPTSAIANRTLRRTYMPVLAIGIVLLDLFAFGHGLNPAIEPTLDRPISPIIEFLHEHVKAPYRIVGIGEELPPNLAMRYGLADCRNYDSIELSSSLDWFEPMYLPEPNRAMRSSRRTITWETLLRARDRLREALVLYAVGAEQPPEALRPRATRVGNVWAVRLDAATPNFSIPRPGEIRIDAISNSDDRVVVPVAYDPGWRVRHDQPTARIGSHHGAFLAVTGATPGKSLVLQYDPIEFRVGMAVSLVSAILMGLLSLQDAWRRVVRKNDPGAWMPELASDRIEAVRSPFFDLPRRLSTEGCDTDGPLHV